MQMSRRFSRAKCHRDRSKSSPSYRGHAGGIDGHLEGCGSLTRACPRSEDTHDFCWSLARVRLHQGGHHYVAVCDPLPCDIDNVPQIEHDMFKRGVKICIDQVKC